MPTPVIKLVVLLLAVAQGVVGVAPGRVLCLPTGDCGLHAPGAVGVAAPNHDQDSSGDDGHWGGSPACSGHHHGPIAEPVGHSHDGCGCHVHVPLPGEKRLPEGRDLRADVGHLRLVAATIVVGELDWQPAHSYDLTPRVGAPDAPFGERALALRSTRLLI